MKKQLEETNEELKKINEANGDITPMLDEANAKIAQLEQTI